MDVTPPAGRAYVVRRPWLPWRQRLPLDAELVVTALACLELVLRLVLAVPLRLLRAGGAVPYVVEVHDRGAPAGDRVVRREAVRGRRASLARVRELAAEVGQG